MGLLLERDGECIGGLLVAETLRAQLLEVGISERGRARHDGELGDDSRFLVAAVLWVNADLSLVQGAIDANNRRRRQAETISRIMSRMERLGQPVHPHGGHERSAGLPDRLEGSVIAKLSEKRSLSRILARSRRSQAALCRSNITVLV